VDDDVGDDDEVLTEWACILVSASFVLHFVLVLVTL
jgi:hypothetical protein